MRFGVMMFPTDTAIRPDELARAVEERGFESLWFPEHSHIPVSRKTPWGGVPGAAPLPEEYWRTHDQYVALTACAMVTSRLKVASGITLVAQRDPIWLAKAVASLDQLSGGRFIFGIGYGWNVEEMASHGVDFRQRRALTREKVLMMKALWTEEVASFDGDLLHLEPSWAWPKPLQRPHPPIVLGASAGPKTIAHLVEFCDGWIPMGRYAWETQLIDVRRALEAAGRDPDAFEVTFYAASPDNIDQLAQRGIDRAVFRLPSAPAEKVLPLLDTYARAAGLG